MERIVIIDSSPLIGLAIVDGLQLRPTLGGCNGMKSNVIDSNFLIALNLIALANN